MNFYPKLVVYYFSGTGNSENVSKWLAETAREKGMDVHLINIGKTDRLNISQPNPDALVAFVSQFLTQLGQLGLFLHGKLLHRLTIDSRRTALPPHRPKGSLQILLGNDFVPEPKPYGPRLALFEPR